MRELIYILFAIAIFFTAIFFVLLAPYEPKKTRLLPMVVGALLLGVGLIVATGAYHSKPNVVTHVIWFFGYGLLFISIPTIIADSEIYIRTVGIIIATNTMILFIVWIKYGLYIEYTYPIVWVFKAGTLLSLWLYTSKRKYWAALFIPLLSWEVVAMIDLYCCCDLTRAVEMLELPVRLNEVFWSVYVTALWSYNKRKRNG